MSEYKENGFGTLRDGLGERRSLVLLTLIVAAIFIVYFALGRFMLVLPAHVHEALASPPSFSASSPS